MSLYMGLRRVFASGIKLLFGMRVRGREEIPEQGRVILCSNHRSLADPILLGMSIKKRQVRYMAKAELFQKKAAGRFLRALGAFPVRRGTGDQQAMAYAQEILQQEGMLGIFPQGHIIPAGVPFAPACAPEISSANRTFSPRTETYSVFSSADRRIAAAVDVFSSHGSVAVAFLISRLPSNANTVTDGTSSFTAYTVRPSFVRTRWRTP